jgi:hypothetical protein
MFCGHTNVQPIDQGENQKKKMFMAMYITTINGIKKEMKLEQSKAKQTNKKFSLRLVICCLLFSVVVCGHQD